MSEANAPVEGPLSFDRAVASLLPEEPQNEAPEAPAEAAVEADETEGADQASEDTEDQAAEPSEGEETEAEAEAVEPAEPPRYWSKDAKEAFGKLPPELQAVVLAQEGPREEAASKAKAEAAAIRQQADAELAKVSQLAEQLAGFLPQAVETFKSRWGDQEPDWEAALDQLIQNVGVEQAPAELARLQTRYQKERAQLEQTASATTEAQAQAHAAFVRQEAAKLAEIAPDLADPDKGAERRQAVGKFLMDRGVEPDAIRQISASEMSIAYDAMRWREAQAAMKAAPKPKPAAVPKATVRPSASAPQSSPARLAANRFAQTRSVDDAVALLLAKG